MVVTQDPAGVSEVECVDRSQQCEVRFQWISANLEQVTLNMKDEQSRDHVQEILERLM